MSLPDQRTIHIGFNKKEGIDARRSSTSFDACWNKAWSLRAELIQLDWKKSYFTICNLQSMQVTTIENVILAFVLFTMTGAVQWRARRRFCETYPFARRCLGVAAKRDVSANMNTENSREQRLFELKNMLDNNRITDRSESRQNQFSSTDENDFSVNVLKQILNNKQKFRFKQQEEASESLDRISESNFGYPDGF
ncbi:uncharacterized protein LOC125682991 isoform X2 [Ostrea edulis]|uniref:uncharacterized protein LOC125682991 isoform X2 n=1 Tax=Ostrea edulis TaxID=37623 RepID=UPI002094691E|nr:uncharacterized protein LOC125682991 isoform X2 [Ostrea edulis]